MERIREQRRYPFNRTSGRAKEVFICIILRKALEAGREKSNYERYDTHNPHALYMNAWDARVLAAALVF